MPDSKNHVAIIGMGCIFPQSRNLKEYWHLLFNGIDAIEDIPEETHWKLKDYFDKDPSTPDHTYCTKGGFLPSISFDPLSYGIPPNNLEATDTSQLLGLEVAKMALEDAGYPTDHPVLQDKKVNVILGVTGTQELVIPLGARLGHPIWKKALKDSGIRPEKQDEVLDRIGGGYVPWQENSFPGLLGNVVAGRIANRLNLSGTNSVSDAACASSLSAVHTAVMELVTGRCDMSITGGVDSLNDIFMHMCFSKTGVLSHTSDAKPFSKDADGTVLGEGIGMLVLKRLEDAQKDNNRIYAVIKGLGTSSDGRTSAIYAPDAKGQIKALKEAYSQADIDPSTVDLVEAHGTGTRVGDKVEFTALKECYHSSDNKNRTAIGSVKSNIGHTKAAAGAAGIIKTALCLYNKTILPTLKADEPDPELDINNSAFYLSNTSKPWVASSPRRSGISAFGFGGSNFHAVLEEYSPSKEHTSWDGSTQIIALSSDTTDGILKQVQNFRTMVEKAHDDQEKDQVTAWQAYESRKSFSTEHDKRLLIVHSRDENITQNLDAAASSLNGGNKPSNIHFSSGKKQGKLGFLFPGQGSQYTGMGKDLASIFPEALQAVMLASNTFSKKNKERSETRLQDFIFAPPAHLLSKKEAEDRLRSTDIAQPSIGAVSLAMTKILKRFGITPDITCGHSFGELPALCSAGWMDEETMLSLAVARGKYMANAGSGKKDPGSMLAVQAPIQDIESLIKEESLDLVLANKNSHKQGVLSGPSAEIDKAAAICKTKKIRAIKLPVAAAFHSKLVKTAATPFKKALSSKSISATSIEVLSNTTGKLYTRKEADIKEVLGNQLASPVNFIDNIENMQNEGVSTFVEVGPKTVLTGLAKSILKDKDITALTIDQSCGKKSGIKDLANLLCSLASKGFLVELTKWEEPAEQPAPQKMRVPLCGANPQPKDRCERPVSEMEIPQAPEIEKETPVNTNNNKASRRQPEKAVSQPEPANIKRSVSKGSDMTSKSNTNNSNMGLPAQQAMEMVQKGLEAMQQLQTQTAQTHEKFLETQAQASRTLATMLEQTQNLASQVPLHAATPASAVNTRTYQPQNQTAINEEPNVEPAVDLPVTETVQAETPQPETAAPANNETPVEDTAAQAEKEPQVVQPTGQTQSILFEIVSKLTGFPVEMLELEMNIESDLGIDSIKKVEIISELEKQIPACEGLTTENIGSVRTLQDICAAIEQESSTADIPQTATQPQESPASSDSGADSQSAAPVISNILFNIISELTGFPVEMLEPSMSLESDLGIDSIKRVEILSKLEQELDHIDSISSDDVANLKTIEEIINFLAQDKQPAQSEAKKKSPESEGSVSKVEESSEPDKKLTRQKVALKEYPTNQIRFYNGAKIELSSDKKVYLTKDSSNIAGLFKKEFEKSGISAELIDLNKEELPDLSDAAGLVLVPDAFNSASKNQALDFLKSSFLLLKKAAPYLMEAGEQKSAFFATVSFMGGGFGFDKNTFKTDPAYGGLAGLAKTAKIEFKNVLCRALDLPDSKEKCLENIEAAVALMMTQGSVEMGLDGDSCNIPELVEQDIEETSLDLSNEDVVVITGGAKGVTAACAIELAEQYSPTLILMGRSPLPEKEADWSENIDDPAQLKKAILANEFKGKTPKPADLEKIYQKIISSREILNNIALMEKMGSQVQYYPADIRDSKEVDAIFKKIRKQFKKISAVIHGAGVLEDRLIVDKQPEQFSKVLETKIHGLDALLSASGKDPLKYFVLFSSIAARTGNQGQCDYAIANEILNKTAQKLAVEKTDCKTISINWGPWEGGMVNESLKKEFKKRGVELIPLRAGAKQLLLEMGCSRKQDPEVIIGAHLSGPEKTKEPVLSKAMSVPMGLSSAPVLASHKIDNNPVVPFAVLMECQALASEKNNPGLIFAGMDNMRLLKGVKTGTEELSMDINLGKCQPGKHGYHVPASISSEKSDKTFSHATSCVILNDRLPKPPVLSKAAFMSLKDYPLNVEQAYDKILFHGRELQSIQAINGYSQKGVEVVTRLASSPEKWFNPALHSKWIIDPMMFDAAFQAAILWSYEKRGQVCLPNFLANLRLYSSIKNLKGNIRILFTVNEETKNLIKGYFTFLNEDNTVVASITGFEAITAPSLNEKFKNKPLFDKKSILAFAEGNPSEAFGDKYKIFDKEREIARLPRPPYFFMDRVNSADHPQWEMKSGGWIEAQYEIPENEWYFTANRTDTIPFCVLLEIALQPCGWLAAFAGSALQSEERLHFRNLGGKATIIKPVTRNCGTITVRSRMTEVSKAGGMIIQDFDMEMLVSGNMVYKGTTNFGFFSSQALSNQVGIRDSKYAEYNLSEKLLKSSSSYDFSNEAPLYPSDKNTGTDTGMPSKALRMIDKIESLSPNAGLYDKGYIKATKKVDPSEWFFDAHFYQDPVCPGSLGVESFLQMLRFFMLEKYNIKPEEYKASIPVDQKHEWIYRGQIIPKNKNIEIHAHIKETAEAGHNCSVTADGALIVDGICIYEMKDFTAGFEKINSNISSTEQHSLQKNKTVKPIK